MQIFDSTPSRLSAEQILNLVATVALKIRQFQNLKDILSTTTQEIQELLQSDRVLIYRFNPDGSGTIAVESLSERRAVSFSVAIAQSKSDRPDDKISIDRFFNKYIC